MVTLPELRALRVANGVLKAKELPARLKILNWGVNDSTVGTFRVGKATAELLPLNQHAAGYDRIPIDFNHSTLEGSSDHVPGQPPAIFGYGRPAVLPGDGLWLEEVTWTPLGAEKARNFEDLSPALRVDLATGEVCFVDSVALCTNGALYDVTLFSASSGQVKPLHGRARVEAAFEREVAQQRAGPRQSTALPAEDLWNLAWSNQRLKPPARPREGG